VGAKISGLFANGLCLFGGLKLQQDLIDVNIYIEKKE
jgi:hypothetical protein